MAKHESGNGSDLQRQLSQLTPKRRLAALLDAPDARELVRGTPAEDLYFAIAEVGLEDAAELIQLASPNQFRTFMDLAGWRRDRIEPLQALMWLRAARGEDSEEFLAKVDAVDLEVLEFLLRTYTEVYDLEENPDVHPEGVTMESPEGRYLIEFKLEGADLALLRGLLSELFARNPFETSRLLEAVRWDIPSELEEIGYRFRSARLADLGFPELDAAMELFTYVDPASIAKPAAHAATSSTAIVPDAGRVDYLEAALKGLTGQEQQALESELRYLINAALVAEAADPGDLHAVRNLSERAREYLLVGLEYLTGGSPALAADLLRAVPSKRVFQVGFSLTLQLKFRADRMVKQSRAAALGVELVLEPEAGALKQLRRKRPLRALKVEGAEPVPFRSLREIRDSNALLDRVEAQLSLADTLLGDEPKGALDAFQAAWAAPEKLSAELFLAAAVAQAVLQDRPVPLPVPEAKLKELGTKLFEGTPAAPQLQLPVVQRVQHAFEQLVSVDARGETARLVTRVLERILHELGAAFLTAGELGPEASAILPVARDTSR